MSCVLIARNLKRGEMNIWFDGFDGWLVVGWLVGWLVVG